MPASLITSHRRNYLAVLGFVVFLFVLQHFQFVDFRELDAVDWRFRIRGVEKAHPSLVLVIIDDFSLEAIGQWPWPRSVHAVLLDVLSRYSPRFIFYDTLFTEASSLEEDERLARSVENAGNVILPFYYYTERPFRAFFPLDILRESARGIGFVNVPVDQDGHVRRLKTTIETEDRETFYAASVGIYMAQFLNEEKAQSWLRAIPTDREGTFWINYPGPLEAFQHLSFREVIHAQGTEQEEKLRNFLRDKIVLVGISATGTTDLKATPFSSLEPGIIIHASALHTFFTGRFLRTSNHWFDLAVLVSLCLLIAWWTQDNPPRHGLLGTLAVMAFYLAVNLAAFVFFGWILPLMVPLVAMGGTYMLALFSKLIEIWLQGELVNRELNTAARIQEAFLPSRMPGHPLLEIVFRHQFAKQIGGDFYDWIDLGEGRFGVSIGDVSGKGIPAAIYMARAISDFRRENQASVDPAVVCQAMNRLLIANGTAGMFLTMIYVVVDVYRKKLRFVNAGHVPLIWYRHQLRRVEMIQEGRTQPLGLFEEAAYESAEFKLEEGDVVVLVTDGVTETRNFKGQEYGLDRVCQIIAQNAPYQTAHTTVDALLKSLQSFSRGVPPHDDTTLIGLKIRSEF